MQWFGIVLKKYLRPYKSGTEQQTPWFLFADFSFGKHVWSTHAHNCNFFDFSLKSYADPTELNLDVCSIMSKAGAPSPTPRLESCGSTTLTYSSTRSRDRRDRMAKKNTTKAGSLFCCLGLKAAKRYSTPWFLRFLICLVLGMNDEFLRVLKVLFAAGRGFGVCLVIDLIED